VARSPPGPAVSDTRGGPQVLGAADTVVRASYGPHKRGLGAKRVPPPISWAEPACASCSAYDGPPGPLRRTHLGDGAPFIEPSLYRPRAQ
jgi:hypothetical protein